MSLFVMTKGLSMNYHATLAEVHSVRRAMEELTPCT